MPVYQCPYPNCSFETKDVTDELAAVMIKVHAEGAHLSRTKPSKVDRVRRPVIAAAGTSEQWSYFLTRWKDYKAATNITGTEEVIQLLECCDEDLRKDLTRAAGGSLTNKPVAEILQSIKTLAVRHENIMVARVQLQDMSQDEEEPIRTFAARLKGQADVCKFAMDCPSCSTQVNYTNQVVKDVLIKGISDPEIQLAILSVKDQEMSLENTIQYIEGKESGKRSATKISQNCQAASSKQSQYRRSKNQHVDLNIKCGYCGKAGHGKNSPLKTRKSKCPAYGKKCTFCGIPNHTSELCRTRLLESKTNQKIKSA